MAQRYFEAAVTSVAALTGAPYMTIHTGASVLCSIREIGFFTNAATASGVQLIRPANSPVATTSLLGQAQDTGSPASTVNLDTAWSTAPTISTNVPLRKASLPGTIGAGIIWTYPNATGLILPVSSYLVLWNPSGSTGSALSVYMVWEE